MARRFLLVGLLSIFEPVGSVMQLVFANLFCIVYLVIQVQSGPYRKRSDNYLAVACTSSLTISFNLSLVFKYSGFTELAEVEARMSDEQKDLYHPDALIMTVIMLAAVVFTIVILSFVSAANVLSTTNTPTRPRPRPRPHPPPSPHSNPHPNPHPNPYPNPHSNHHLHGPPKGARR